MDAKKVACVIALILIISVFFVSSGWAQAPPKTKAPVITQSYAVDKGKYGFIWKIYIEAEDLEGDMLKIASSVDQVGSGHYPTDFIYLKAKDRKHLKGYLQWNTYSNKAPLISEWTYLTLKVSIFDKAGNESNEVVFPLDFVSGLGPEPKPPAPFDQADIPRLGYIHIDLFDYTLLGGGDARD